MPSETFPRRPFTLKIEKFVPPGQGMGYHAGRAVFVPGSMPDETVLVSPEKIKSKYVLASLERILEASPRRRVAPCPHYDLCGGCDLLHLDYPQQLLLKREMLGEVLRMNGHEVDIDRVFGLGEAGSRHRLFLHYDHRQGSFGLFRRRRHQVVAIPQCLVMAPGLRQLISRLVKSECLPAGIDGIQLLAAREGAGAAVARCGKEFVQLAGVDEIIFEDYGYGRLELSAAGFAQANPAITSAMQKEVAALVPAGARVVELYGGSGTFSLALAARAAQVTVFESDALAVARGRRNAKRLGFDNLDFRIARLDRQLFYEVCDLVFVDPPRTGMNRKLLAHLKAVKPAAIVYVSCNPATLARDLKSLVESFRLEKIKPFDMSPGTTHLEVLASLVRR